MESQVSFIATLIIILLNCFVVANGQGLCFSEHNAERAKHGKPALKYNYKLERAAKVHSNSMVSTGRFTHQSPGEPNHAQRATNAGYSWRSCAENIAWGQTDCKEVMRDWMNSFGHKINILGNFKHVGCGRVNNLWTCDFGTPT